VLSAGRRGAPPPARHLFAQPAHPYTQALLAAAPPPDPERARRIRPLPGEPPSLITPPSGCRFRTRCPIAIDECARRLPTLEAAGEATVACLRAGEVTSHAEL
jgi:peptide/nickel transport system ATP-binding protein